MSDISSHVTDQLSHFLDGQLDDAARTLVEAHLQDCEACRKHYEELSQLRDALRSTPVMDPPESLYEHVLQQIQEPPPARRFSFNLGLPVKALASACVVMLVVWVTREVRRPTSPVSRLNSNQFKNSPPSQPFPSLSKSDSPASVAKPAPVSVQVNKEAPALKEGNRASSAKLNEMDELQRQLASAPPPKPLSQRKDITYQARDIGGVASQNSFDREKAGQLQLQTRAKITSSRAETPQQAAPMTQPVALGELMNDTAKTEAANRPADALRAPKGNPFSVGDLPEWRGLNSGIKKFRTVAVRSATEWGKLWREQTGTQAPAPQVNFNEYMIIGVYAGEKPAGGSAVQILSTEEVYPPALIVNYHEVPLPAGAKTASLIQPFHLWVIPQTVLPVKFKKK